MRHLPASAAALAALLALAGCGWFSGLAQPPAAPAKAPEKPVLGPWLLDPQAGNMTVAWTTAAPAVGRVWYGTAAADRLATETGPAVTDHRVTLPALAPQTQVRYRIEGAGEEHVFTTAPQAGAEGPIRVLVYGDNRSNDGDHALVARALAGEHAQLALHTGDMVAAANDDGLWRTWFSIERDLLAGTPLVAAVGNHEITDQGVTCSRWFQHRDGPAYWSVDYGPVHVAVLDSFETAAGATPRSAGVSEAQKAWFEEDLRGVPRDRHVWVLVHQGPYGHPAHPRPGHGGSEAVRSAIAAGSAVHPIEAVFAGHEHFYERGEIDGLKYFVFGGGGAPLDDPAPTFPGVQAARKALSYATVEVCGCHAWGQVKDIAGKVIDTFRLAECATPCGAPGAAINVSAVAPEAHDGGGGASAR